MRDNDELLRKMANIYVERYNRELQEEQERLERINSDTISELRLERRVRKRIAAQKRKPYLRVLPALAACFALMLLLPRVLNLDVQVPPVQTAPAPAAPAPPAPAAPTAPAQEAPASNYAIIPLSTPLPYGFAQSGFDQDREKSIYYIEDLYQDHVVLTLEETLAKPDTTGLVEIRLGESVVYGTQADGYSLLTFNRSGVLYTLTCRHDINTLVRLGSVFFEI